MKLNRQKTELNLAEELGKEIMNYAEKTVNFTKRRFQTDSVENSFKLAQKKKKINKQEDIIFINSNIEVLLL